MAPIGPNGEPLPYPQDGGKLEDWIPEVLELIQAGIQADGHVTQQERLTFEKVRTLLQQLSASREKEDQAAIGSSPAMNSISRAYGAS